MAQFNHVIQNVIFLTIKGFQMDNQNWPNGTNYGHQNWTGRYERVGSWKRAEGAYAEGSEEIPFIAWVGGILFVLTLTAVLPAIFVMVGM